MAMLRLPTFIAFPFILWNRKGTLDEDEEYATDLLLPEETLIKHHGSIYPYITEEVVLAPESIQPNFFSLLKENDIKHEFIAILRFSIPLMLTFILSIGNRVVDVWFLGKLGPEGIYLKKKKLEKKKKN